MQERKEEVRGNLSPALFVTSGDALYLRFKDQNRCENVSAPNAGLRRWPVYSRVKRTCVYDSRDCPKVTAAPICRLCTSFFLFTYGLSLNVLPSRKTFRATAREEMAVKR